MAKYQRDPVLPNRGEGPPYTIVPMPLNRHGKGPEMNPRWVASTVYQVWDACNMAVGEYDTEDEAKEAKALLDNYAM